MSTELPFWTSCAVQCPTVPSQVLLCACVVVVGTYTMLVMGKKKGEDRHRDPKLTIRIPAVAGEALRRIADSEDRTLTAVILRALKAYAQANGHNWPTSLAPPP